MPPLPTGKQVYDRIRWDDALDPRWFTIGVAERGSEAGIVEIPYEDFVPEGEIPWHRIRYYRVGAAIIWDRATKVDRLADLRASAISTGAAYSSPTTGDG